MKKQGNPKRAVGYCRVSTEDQKLSPEAQRASIQQWAAREGVEIVVWCSDLDCCSVTPIEQREGLAEAMASLEEYDAGFLVVAKRDRLSREVLLTLMIEREVAASGAQVVSAAGEGNGDSPEAAMLRGIIDVFAQYERSLIRARTKAALAVKARRSEFCGGRAPLGYRVIDGPPRMKKDGTVSPLKLIEEDPMEQEAIAEARRLRKSGFSFRKIANELRERGLTGRNGQLFQVSAIQRMVAA